MARFKHYIGIDYSGARGPDNRLRGLKIYRSHQSGPALKQVPLSDNPSWNWTRREVAEFIEESVHSSSPVIIGIDHAFSLPNSYFQRHSINSWDEFLDDFVKHWPTDSRSVESLRNSNERAGDRSEFRLTERRAETLGKAKSVFQLDGQGTVGKSTHSGIPFLRSLRRNNRTKLHFWPFDGWQISPGSSVILEVYPRLFLENYKTDSWDVTQDERDARVVTNFLSDSDRSGHLEGLLTPDLADVANNLAEIEGWILGVQ
jgi:hypothetical protein|tara:strand:- start:1356 stop:2132 length:777 start_codon:yes stop_codon:yes gene_type:complete